MTLNNFLNIKTRIHKLLIACLVSVLSFTSLFASKEHEEPFSKRRKIDYTSSLTLEDKQADADDSERAPSPSHGHWKDIMFQDFITDIAPFIPMRKALELRLVCKEWAEMWNDSTVWEQYARRIPGYERSVAGFSTIFPINYQEIILALMTPKLISFSDDEDVIIRGISAKGDMIVGENNENTFFWTQKEGMQILKGEEYAHACAVSVNDKVRIVGMDGRRPCLWESESDTPEMIGEGIGGPSLTISTDGTAIAGEMRDPETDIFRAFVRRRGQGIEYLTEDHSKAYTINTDGTVVAGGIQDTQTHRARACVWKKGNDVKFLEDKNGYSCVNAMNAEGTVFAGEENDSESNMVRAVIWTSERGIEFLGGEGRSSSRAMSADGHVIVGTVQINLLRDESSQEILHPSSPDNELYREAAYNDYKAFIWTREYGMLLLEKILGKALPKDYPLEEVTGMSADGTLIVGDGTLPWYVYIPRFDAFVREGVDLLKRSPQWKE